MVTTPSFSVHEKCVERVHVSESFSESVLLKNRFRSMIRDYFIPAIKGRCELNAHLNCNFY